MRYATCNKPSRCSTLLSGESTTIALHFSKNATKCRPARPARLPKKQRRKERSQEQRRGQPPGFERKKEKMKRMKEQGKNQRQGKRKNGHLGLRKRVKK